MLKTKKVPINNTEQQINVPDPELLELARIRFEKDSILFILWGWALACFYTIGNLMTSSLYMMRERAFFDAVLVMVLAFALIYSIYYLVRNCKKRSPNSIHRLLRYVWVMFCVAVVVIHIIQAKASDGFYIQHSVIYLMIAFAHTITGGILRYRLLIIYGLIIGIGSYFTFVLSYNSHCEVGAFAFLVAFIIPGHVLYYRYKKKMQAQKK